MGLKRHYSKYGQLHRERQILYDLTYMWNLKKKKKKKPHRKKFRFVDLWLQEAGGWGNGNQRKVV